MSLKAFLKKIIYKEKSSSKSYINYLRSKGVVIGDNCIIYDPRKVQIDLQNPWMLTIGNSVRITTGVQILTHDYSFSVLSCYNGNIVGSVEEVVIGNNVFIGRDAIILKGVHIGDNVVIGAGSIVAKDCESDSVYAGVPAKRICGTYEMYEKWKKNEVENAKKVACNYYNRMGKLPDAEILREYQEVFTKTEHAPESLEKLFQYSGSYELCKQYFETYEPAFPSLEAFLDWCGLTKRGNHE